MAELVNDRYELTEPVGSGGMGDVWLGRDVRLDRKVAVKLIRWPDGERDDELVRRFVRESRIAARLQHPGVPAIYDVGAHGDRPYLVMQYVDGARVADLIAEHGPLPTGWAAAVAAQTCAVLAAAHAESLVHRDLKPSNLMLDRDGCVRVLDFGLAVALDRSEQSQLTRTGQILGTVYYMAPEQIQASLSGPRTDLYGLGCVLYEMLTGERAFSGRTEYEVMRRQVEERPRPLRDSRPDLPADMADLVFAMLEKKLDDRPGSAVEVHQRLLPFVTDLSPLPGVVVPPAAPNPVWMHAGLVERIAAGVTGQPGAGGSPRPPAQRSSPGGTGPGSPTGEVRPRPSPGSGETGFSRGELDRAREQASGLIEQSCYGQAADVLARVVEPASRVLGDGDDEVLSLRRQYATVLFEGGDYRRAAPQYRRLARDLAARYGPDTDEVLHNRYQEATCHAVLGETTLALEQLTALLTDRRRVSGDDDQRTLDLRRQIGLLQLGVGQREQAGRTLRGLLDDLIARYGPDHRAVAEVRDLLAGIHPVR